MTIEKILIAVVIFAFVALIGILAAFALSRFVDRKEEEKRKEYNRALAISEVYFSDDTHAATMFFLINDERVRRKLRPLEFDYGLAAEASVDLRNGDRHLGDAFFVTDEEMEDPEESCMWFWKTDPFLQSSLWSEKTIKIGVSTYEEEIEGEYYRFYLAKTDS